MNVQVHLEGYSFSYHTITNTEQDGSNFTHSVEKKRNRYVNFYDVDEFYIDEDQRLIIQSNDKIVGQYARDKFIGARSFDI